MGEKENCSCSVQECERFANQVYCALRFTSYEMLTVKRAVMVSLEHLEAVASGRLPMPEIWEDETLSDLNQTYKKLEAKVGQLIEKVDRAEEKRPGAASSIFFCPNRFDGLEMYYIQLAFQVYFWFLAMVQDEKRAHVAGVALESLGYDSFQEAEQDAAKVRKKVESLLLLAEE